MWLYLITVVGLIGGAAAALMGLGPVAIVLIAAGIAGLAVKVFGSGGGGSASPADAPASGHTMSSTGGRVTTERPQDDEHRPEAHVDTGVAHAGQQRMTPDQ